jgi:subtilisin family serine protease
VRPRGLIPSLVVSGLLIAAVPASAASAPPFESKHSSGYAPGELIVKFKPGVASAERTDVLRERHADVEHSLPIPRTTLVRIPAGDDVRSAAKDLERDARVASAEPNVYREGAAVPNDPFFAEQWGLQNTGQTVEGVAGAAGVDIHAPQAWDRTTGSSAVKVAVVDSGINFDQPDLAPNIWHNPGESGNGRESNGIDDDGNGFVDDWRGWDFVQRDNDPSDNQAHGTHVAGTIAARGDNGIGVAGVAWRASIIPVRVLDNTNEGYCSEIAAGMAYAVKAGARIVNVSLGFYGACQAEQDVIDAAPSTLFVAAAMNDSDDDDVSPVYPCSYPEPNVVCVAATDSHDQLASFSNYGARNVDLAAPGVSILSTFLKWAPQETVLSDGFETPLAGRWATGGTPNTWTRTPFVGLHSGGYALSNSTLGAYDDNTDNWASFTVDLSNKRDCAVAYWATWSLGTYDASQPLRAQDFMAVQAQPGGADWARIAQTYVGTQRAYSLELTDLSPLEGRPPGLVTFRLVTNPSDTFGGVAIDDLRVVCAAPLTTYTGARDEFEFDFGTSMAAPHVSGVAVLLLSLDPQLTAAELKQRLLSTVDPLPGLAGKTVSGGRLNAARAVDLPPRTAANNATGTQTPRRKASRRARMASALAADLRTVARSLASVRIRALLKRGGLGAVHLHALAAGRFTLTLRSASGKTIARGTRTCKRAGRCTLAVHLTRRGRSLLHHARRLRVTVELAFKPRSGPAIARRTTATLG